MEVIEIKATELHSMVDCEERKIEEEILDYLIRLQVLESRGLK